MVEFCPECGSLLRKKSCPCGYNAPSPKKKETAGILEIWDPPSPKVIYCKITGTPFDKLKKDIKKGIYPEGLKKIKQKLKKHLIDCINCVYFRDDILHCKIRNKYMKEGSICRKFEPYEDIIK